MDDHLLTWALAAFGSFVAALVAALAFRVRVFPKVIDVSIILTFSGLGAVSFTMYGVLRRFHTDRVARLTYGGTVLGTVAGVCFFLLVLLLERI